MTKLNMQAARTKLAIRTKIVKTLKLNYKNDPTNIRSKWKCDDCTSRDIFYGGQIDCSEIFQNIKRNLKKKWKKKIVATNLPQMIWNLLVLIQHGGWEYNPLFLVIS